MQRLLIDAMERRWLPDGVIRTGIRKLCKQRLKSLERSSLEDFQDEEMHYLEQLKSSPIAIYALQANQQHYELPPEFFKLVLGKHLKYSSAFWSEQCKTLDQAERDALSIYLERAEIQDGMKILELGCGWGSLTLTLAQSFPKSQIIALSNSAPQRQFIESELKARGLQNVKVLTRNIAEVGDLGEEFGAFDRVVSIEMFEHMKNYEALLEKIGHWLKPEGKLFVHIFTHKLYSYPFEVVGEDNWMGRYFFTGGQMPGRYLLSYFQKHLILERQWAWDGTHYGKTSEAWLNNLDAHEPEVLKIFSQTYGPDQAKIWLQRWRVFFMSCAELFNYKNGTEWGVTHYLFKKASHS